MNVEGGKRSNSWHAPGVSSLRCPYPGCGHTASIITKVHCQMQHGMEREEMAELYGLPVIIRMRAAFKGEKGVKHQ